MLVDDNADAEVHARLDKMTKELQDLEVEQNRR
jgi:hypothetical protein